MTGDRPRTTSGTGRSRNPVTQTRGRVNAGVGGLGGVGGGTGLTALAMHIGADTTMGQVLIFLVPAFSVISGVAFYQLKSWSDWSSEKLLVWRARRTLETQLKNSNTSDERKVAIRKMLEDMDRLVAEAEFERVTQKINSRRSSEDPQPS